MSENNSKRGLPIACIPLFQWGLRRLPRGSHRLIPLVERCFNLDEVVTARLNNGQLMRVRSHDVMHRLLFWLGAYEPYVMKLFLSLLGERMTVLDIGANAGYFTLMAAERVGPRGRVIAFEPVSENLSLLRDNVSLNHCQNTTVENLAVSDSETPVRLFLYRKDVNSGMASVVGTEVGSSIETRMVPACSIDSYLSVEEIGEAHVIKMDVQGGEGRALDGMWEMLSRGRGPILIWEVNPAALAQHRDSAARLLEVLESKGYESLIIGAGTLTRIKPDAAEGLPEGCMLISLRSTWQLPEGWAVSG